jgi:hypothetical protein
VRTKRKSKACRLEGGEGGGATGNHGIELQ